MYPVKSLSLLVRWTPRYSLSTPWRLTGAGTERWSTSSCLVSPALIWRPQSRSALCALCAHRLLRTEEQSENLVCEVCSVQGEEGGAPMLQTNMLDSQSRILTFCGWLATETRIHAVSWCSDWSLIIMGCSLFLTLIAVFYTLLILFVWSLTTI